jgi:N-acetylneuraminate synthase
MIEIKSPGKGLAPLYIHKLIGSRASRNIKCGDFFIDRDIGNRDRPEFRKKFKSKWGLIARFTDFQEMLNYQPRVLEFHLAERDFDLPFSPDKRLDIQLVVHAPEYMGERLLDLCSENENIREESVALVIKTIKFTRTISCFFQGKPKVIAHPGAMSMNRKLDPEKLSSNLARSLAEIESEPATTHVELLFENLPPYPWYFGGQWKGNYFMDANEIASFCERYNTRICFDLSHSALYCNAKEKELSSEIRTLLPYTRHLHLADGYGLDGEGVQFGEGDINLEKILPIFKGFKGTWVPEIWRGHLEGGKGFIIALSYLSKYMD